MSNLQVLDMKQAAQVLTHADTDKPILKDLVDLLAQQMRSLANQEPAEYPLAGISPSDWRLFWEYAEAISPEGGMHVSYMPMKQHQQQTPFETVY